MQDDASPDAKLLIPGLGHFYRHLSRYSYSFMRFCTGAVLVPHGAQKVLYIPINQFAGNIAAQGFPAPTLLAYVTYFTELVAAACLALACSRVSLLCSAVFFRGGGRYSLDRLIGKEF